ncbi:glycosyltransferase family 2 protein [Arsenicitalea aurantiaca]|uniref:Glycosyltransferase family 2 protein n=1 Tax=Arsenicitalea aurantiaca TaxID=1783274 RepID=A0A433X8G5_9HYPH|nr:glycosyltransferase family 2 protein [Arsenicitalea aurantiaca]RUT30340.1 glycosyltransferase family 2 protein [Arsenicitalea aurantiaca]
MDRTVSIVMPAFRAQDGIVGAARSVLGQTHADFELVIVSDDGVDYEAVLGARGIADERIRHVSSGNVGSGASRARNFGLAAMTGRYGAVLDADDRMKPEKLAMGVAALEAHAIVTTALDVVDAEGRHLRFVGAGPDRALRPGTHKFTSLSMDSMVLWDREATDARYDPEMPNLNDLDFLLRLYRAAPASYHLGTPLHEYVKLPVSLSNGPGVEARMIAAKTTLRRRLAEGYYGLPAEDVEGLDRFLAISLEAEKRFAAALAERPGLLFEDHLEPMLAASSPA